MVQDLARAFGEEMGFFLDEKSFASSSIAEKNLWIDEQPIFGFKTPEELQLADALRMSETKAAPAAEKTPTPPVAADEVKSTIPEAPAPVAQPTPLAPEYQPVPVAPAAQPIPAAPVYEQAPTQPVSTTPPAAPPVYYQPAPPAPIAPPTPAAPVYYQPAPPAPIAPPTPAAPVYYQPAPPAPTEQPTPAPAASKAQPTQKAQPIPAAPAKTQPAPQTPSHRMYQKEVEVEPQIEVEVEVDAPPPSLKTAAVPRSTAEKGKASGATSRTAPPVQSNPLEEEQREVQKTPPRHRNSR